MQHGAIITVLVCGNYKPFTAGSFFSGCGYAIYARVVGTCSQQNIQGVWITRRCAGGEYSYRVVRTYYLLFIYKQDYQDCCQAQKKLRKAAEPYAGNLLGPDGKPLTEKKGVAKAKAKGKAKAKATAKAKAKAKAAVSSESEKHDESEEEHSSAPYNEKDEKVDTKKKRRSPKKPKEPPRKKVKISATA